VERRTGFAPGEIVLLDDTPGNLKAARAAGWGALHWTGGARLPELIAGLF